MAVSGVTIPSVVMDCRQCGHSARLHNDDGCIVTRCTCWQNKTQAQETPVVRSVLNGDNAPCVTPDDRAGIRTEPGALDGAPFDVR